MKKIDVRCLPYPGKSSTIGKVIAWFNKEIRALPSAIMKANNNFLVYCLAGVLKMLNEGVKCDHLDGLDAIMSSCDASILGEIPDHIAKIVVRIMKRWWTSHGLPYVTGAFRVELEVWIFVTCCTIWWFLVLC
jgi:hypothetical protein